MSSTQDFFDILQTVTVDCKDNGECFTVTDRVAAIEQMLEQTDYKLIGRQPLALLYSKREVREGDRVLLISSHIDCVYGSCFCNDEDDCMRGTFDNSFTNAALLWNMLQDRLPDNVVVAFTGDEEKDSQGAVQTVVALGQMGCEVATALVLDVTNEGWERGALFTLENDLGIDILTGYSIISSLEQYGGRFAFKHNALPDESWDYADYGIPSITLCVPVGGELHGDAGVLLRKESALEYSKVLAMLASLLF
ncbi:MAG: M28 family peptidase [Bacteroidaceae bacterium]|nr:M28 family peptidase [Bacteroidaceae bacterium]